MIKYLGVNIELVDGDIAEQETDAVVTAAHWKLNGGNGTFVQDSNRSS